MRYNATYLSKTSSGKDIGQKKHLLRHLLILWPGKPEYFEDCITLGYCVHLHGDIVVLHHYLRIRSQWTLSFGELVKRTHIFETLAELFLQEHRVLLEQLQHKRMQGLRRIRVRL